MKHIKIIESMEAELSAMKNDLAQQTVELSTVAEKEAGLLATIEEYKSDLRVAQREAIDCRKEISDLQAALQSVKEEASSSRGEDEITTEVMASAKRAIVEAELKHGAAKSLLLLRWFLSSHLPKIQKQFSAWRSNVCYEVFLSKGIRESSRDSVVLEKLRSLRGLSRMLYRYRV